MGSARHYTGQLNIIAHQQAAFKKAFKIHYTRRLRQNHHMATDGMKWQAGDVVMISDLSASDRQPPYPVLGIIHEFMDQLHAQAVVHYGAGKTVNRPLSLLTRLVPVEDQIPAQGLMFDPWTGQDEFEVHYDQEDQNDQEDQEDQ